MGGGVTLTVLVALLLMEAAGAGATGGRAPGAAPRGQHRQPHGPREPAQAAGRLRPCGGPGDRRAPLGLIMFDLNGFKAYNDSFGHPAGDALLARLGARLAAASPRGGLPAGRGRVLRRWSRWAPGPRPPGHGGHRGADRGGRGLRDHERVRSGPAATGCAQPGRGHAPGGPAHVPAEGPRPGLGRPPERRRADTGAARALPRAPGAPRRRERAQRERRPAHGPERTPWVIWSARPGSTTWARWPSPSRSSQARPARRAGDDLRPPPHADRGANPPGGPRPGARGGPGAGEPRALGRRRLSRRARRRADPAGRAHHLRLRRLRGDDLGQRPYRSRSRPSSPWRSCAAVRAPSSTRAWSRSSRRSSAPTTGDRIRSTPPGSVPIPNAATPTRGVVRGESDRLGPAAARDRPRGVLVASGHGVAPSR